MSFFLATITVFNQNKSSMIFQIILGVAVLMMIERARSGQKIPKIRRLAGLDALDEAIGRATEMGRPVMYDPGGDGLSNAQTIASFSVLSYIVRSCARYDTRFIAMVRSGVQIYGVVEGIVRENYAASGKGDSFDPTMVRFLASGWGANTTAAIGLIKREQVAANAWFGGYYAETMMLTEISNLQGSIQVAATAQTAQLPFFIAACDYTLIGEELFAAGAYLATDHVPKANLVVLDYFKIATAVLLVVGALLATMGNTWLYELLRNT